MAVGGFIRKNSHSDNIVIFFLSDIWFYFRFFLPTLSLPDDDEPFRLVCLFSVLVALPAIRSKHTVREVVIG